jgi:hypothetical protein
MDIRDDLERIHVAKVVGKPLMDCLREVVWISARVHRAAKFSADDIRRRATLAAWDAAVEYDWVVTDVERATAQGFLRAYADQWMAEALSGKPEAITKPLADIRDDLERIHAAKVAGKPLMDCLREVVWASARVHLDAKFSGDDIRWRAAQSAWDAAVEYGWVVTDVERATVQGYLRAYIDQWIAEALSGEADNPPSPNPPAFAKVGHPAMAKPAADRIQTETTPAADTSPLGLLKSLIERHGIEETVRRLDERLRPDGRVARSTLLAWRASERGEPVSRPLKPAKRHKIAEAIRRIASGD